MGFIIEDGATGNTARVTADNRLMIVGQSGSIADIEAVNGNSYDFTTTVVNLTNAVEAGIFYLQNTNSTKVLQVARFAMSMGATTGGGTADAFIRLISNPTGGTLLSAGTLITGVNRNFGVITPALAVCRQGALGSTVTGGTVAAVLMTAASSRNIIDSEVVLPVGASLALTVQPPAANTSMNVAIFLVTCYVDPANV